MRVTSSINLTQNSRLQNSNFTENNSINTMKLPGNNKQNALPGRIAAIGIASIATAAILIHKNKIPTEVRKAILEAEKTNNAAKTLATKVQKEAETIIDSVDSIKTKAQKMLDEALDSFKKGEETNYQNVTDKSGNLIKKFSNSDNVIEMHEFGTDGSLLKTSTKHKYMDTLIIEDFTNKTEFEYLGAKLRGYAEGYEKLTDGSFKANKTFCFAYEKLDEYSEGYEIFPDGSIKKAKSFCFAGKKLELYREDSEALPDESWAYAKKLWFNNNETINKYTEGCKYLNGRSEKIDKHLSFISGKLETYTEGFERLFKKGEKIDKYLSFTDGKPDKYREGFKELADESEKVNIDTYFDKKSNKWKNTTD